MRNIDFSWLGGFPLTQEGLDFMQKGYQEPLNALAAMGGSAPHIISGMVESGSVLSDGYLFYNGEPIPFIGGSIGATIVINTYNTVLEYGDGNSHSVQSRKEASFGTGAVQFNYVDLKLFQEGFGKRARSAWTACPYLNTGVSAFYLHDKLNNTVTVRGSAPHSQALYLGNPEMKIMAELPADLQAPQIIPFRTNIVVHQVPEIFDSHGGLYTGEAGRLSQGFISIASRSLALGTANPTHSFYFTYQL